MTEERTNEIKELDEKVRVLLSGANVKLGVQITPIGRFTKLFSKIIKVAWTIVYYDERVKEI
jgi:hypothetical protein